MQCFVGSWIQTSRRSHAGSAGTISRIVSESADIRKTPTLKCVKSKRRAHGGRKHEPARCRAETSGGGHGYQTVRWSSSWAGAGGSDPCPLVLASNLGRLGHLVAATCTAAPVDFYDRFVAP